MKRIYILILLLIFCGSTLCLGLVSQNASEFPIATNNDSFNSYPTLIIDAGHGGEDSGTVSGKGYLEKDINLDIALTLKKLLNQSGFSTEMIRETDVSIHSESASTTKERKISDIHNRVDIANSDKNNILISIHQNHFSEVQYSGAQIFYSKNNLNSQILAENIRRAITELLQKDNTRKCKQASGVYLLDNVTVPAVIVECGFLSNYEEAEKLSSKSYRDSMAYSIYLGILEYIYLNY